MGTLLWLDASRHDISCPGPRGLTACGLRTPPWQRQAALVVLPWALTFCGLFMARAAFPATSLYLAPNGRDDNPGTRAKPLQTLEGARDAIRKLEPGKRHSGGGVTV